MSNVIAPQFRDTLFPNQPTGSSLAAIGETSLTKVLVMQMYIFEPEEFNS